MRTQAGRRIAAPARRTMYRLLCPLALLVLAPLPTARSAASDSGEREPQRELILLASGAIAGNLEPCG